VPGPRAKPTARLASRPRPQHQATQEPAADGWDPDAIIQTRGLTKRYGTLTAVDHLDLAIRPGEIFALLGPNGAGKTTTVLMLLGLSEPSGGEARVVGLDPTRHPLEVKRRVGYLPDNVGFYGGLTARQNLRYTAYLNGLGRREADERIESLLEQVDLTADAHRRVGEFSRGMRQRLGIADALISDPALLILDEPTIAIDPIGVAEILALIRGLVREHGLTVLLSSHLLEQVESICDRVGIFCRGKLLAQGTVVDLAAQAVGDDEIVLEVGANAPGEVLEAALAVIPGVERIGRHEVDDRLRLVTAGRDLRVELVRELGARDLPPIHLVRRGEALEAIYRRYIEQCEGGSR